MSSTPPAPSAPVSGAANDVAQGLSHAQWAEIMQQLGAEIAGPLSAALERIHNLTVTGQIDRQGLRALRESVAQAREAGMMGQQLARLAAGRLRLARERLHLAQLLRNVLAHRSRETQARGIQVRQMFKPVEVMADGALMFALLNALMDWALTSTHSSIDLRLDLTPWPAKARLVCRFAHRSLDLLEAQAGQQPPASLNSLAWRLVEQTALTMGVLPLREDASGITVLTLEFPQTIGDEPGLATPPPAAEPDPALAANSKPLAGSHLLIVSPRRELRQQLQEAVRHMGLIIDAVATMDEALQFCAEGLPHGILFESPQRGPALEQLRAELLREVPEFSFIEVLDGEQLTQLSTATPDGIARIARQHLADALPAMLLFELSKTH
ncbi:hypothetical protein G8A07_24735 [Roseateles sp. DAIF2]|uniref:hypothetical protein n=1 Tax=Roseateles sp. DAIF2 TaxID=2714952 RepID=UPI0018A2B710|nr:hypothetical protein [Roseateles sp. DAIF2]QPF75798.1 hypothetical protein G8A07_24735 [Roseateles sp. DAIF2]